jgi:hypothetical protein
MLAKKIIMGLVLLTIATTVATTSAFANAPGGAYIQCDGSYSSPVRLYAGQLVVGRGQSRPPA